MTVRTWQVESDGKIHTVELDHGTLSGKRIITVDGRPAVQLQTLDHLVWDVGGSYPVPIGNKEGVVRIRLAAMSLLGCRYDLVWDGTSISPQPVPRRPNNGLKLWLVVATAICLAVILGAVFLPAPSGSSAK